MIVDPYTAETNQPLAIMRGAKGIGVQRVQEWLGLHSWGVAIDGDFGPATEAAVIDFKRHTALMSDTSGKVDSMTWGLLVGPLACAGGAKQDMTFGQAALANARGHLAARAREIGGDNCGPFVRHYCRGQSVAWCQGFASTMWADAARLLAIAAPLDLVLDGIWCLFVPRMVNEAAAKGLLRTGGSGDGFVPPPGAMFFLRGGAYGYLHVGIVEQSDGTLMRTIEGNTNETGGANGYEVARRTRLVASSDFALPGPAI